LSDNENVTTSYFSHCWGVFEGGGVRAAAHAGAHAAAKQAGIVFGRVAGTSAGSIVAALIAAGASHEYISEELKELNFSDFLGVIQPQDSVFVPVPSWQKALRSLTWGKPRRFVDVVLYSGLYSSHPLQDWLEAHLKKLVRGNKIGGPQGPVRFSELSIPLHVVATDLAAGEPKVWSCETTPEDSVAAAVRCSCTIPFFYQAVSHQSSVLVDGGAVSNLPSFVFTALLEAGRGRSVLSRILAFRLLEQPKNNNPIKGLQEFAERLSNAAIDGAANIQLSLQPNIYQVLISTGSIRSTDFNDVGTEEKQQLHEAGRDAVRKFIATERLIVRKSHASLPYQGFDEKMLLLVQELQGCTENFLAVGASTYWLDFVFPTVLALARRGVKILLVAPSAAGDIKEERRRWLLRELGAEIIDSDGIVIFDGFVFDSTLDKASALLSNFDKDGYATRNNYLSERIKLYTDDSDPAVLALLRQTLLQLQEKIQAISQPLPYAACADVILFDLLKKIPHYSSAKFRLADIEVSDNIMILNESVKEYKLLQVKHHISALKHSGFDLFELVQVCLPSGKTTIVTPPVLERVGDKLVLIDGHARFFYCIQNGITSIRAVVVDNVTAALPAKNPRPLSALKLISLTTSVDAMYENMDRSLFRRIDEVAHPFP